MNMNASHILLSKKESRSIMFLYYINVPLNRLGIQEFENYQEGMPNVRTFKLSELEYNQLRKQNGLFDKFHKAFGIIIARCEDERLNLEDIPRAIRIAENQLKKAADEAEVYGCQTILYSLRTALEAQTFWDINVSLSEQV